MRDLFFKRSIRAIVRILVVIRKQYVTTNFANSKLEEVRTGVNQGTNFGPLPSIIFINDIKSNQEITKKYDFCN